MIGLIECSTFNIEILEVNYNMKDGRYLMYKFSDENKVRKAKIDKDNNFSIPKVRKFNMNEVTKLDL